MSDDLNLAIANLGDDDLVAEVTNAALNLDAVVEELLEGGDIEDLVVGGLRSVDDVLQITINLRLRENSGGGDIGKVTNLLGDLLGLATTGLLRKLN